MKIINFIKKSLISSMLRTNMVPFYKDNKYKPKQYYSYKFVRNKLILHNLSIDIYNSRENRNFIYNTNYKNIISNFKIININNDKKLTAEHIVPQSYSKIYKFAKMDAHNIYVTSSHYNSNRNNFKYVDEKDYVRYNDTNCFIELSNQYINYNNYYNYKDTKSKLFIPIEPSRGMIARAVGYMKLTYPDLQINNVIDYNTIIEWNKRYPPLKYEKIKNELCYILQGNRNIFIDNYILLNFFIFQLIQDNDQTL